MKLVCAFVCFTFCDIFQYVLQRFCYKSIGSVVLLSATELLPSQILKPCVMVFFGRQEWYLLQNGKKHSFPDRYTKDMIRCKYLNLLKSKVNEAYLTGDPIKSLQVSAPNTAMLSLLKNGIGIVRDTYLLEQAVLNPSLVYRNGSAFLSGAWTKGSQFQRLVWMKNAHNISVVQEFVKRQNFVKDNTLQSIKFIAEDSRLFVSKSNRIYFTFCRRFKKTIPELQMAYAEAIYRNNSFQMSPIVDIKFNEFAKSDQKNWCPFDYNGRMLFVSQVQPHRIIGLTSDPLDAISKEESSLTLTASILSTEAFTISLTNISNIMWKYGDMRGGTPPVYIGDNRYLSFFHSSTDIIPGGAGVQTYNFGAYVFDSQPPFAIRAMSRHPIVHQSMYSGPWIKNEHAFHLIDYVAFPMSFDIREGIVYLLYGKQDKAGWIAEISLISLLQSLRPVQSDILQNTYK